MLSDFVLANIVLLKKKTDKIFRRRAGGESYGIAVKIVCISEQPTIDDINNVNKKLC